MRTTRRPGQTRVALVGLAVLTLLLSSAAAASHHAAPAPPTPRAEPALPSSPAAEPPAAADPVSAPTVETPETADAVDPLRDLVVDPLCEDALRLVGTELCTHGPDEPIEASAGDTAAAGQGSALAACDQSAATTRVQAVYAFVADHRDRFAELAPRIREWAGHADAVFQASSGGARAVRWVVDGACGLHIARIQLSADARDSFAVTARELRAAGLDRPDRRYLVWFDADVYCGIATMFHDDRASGLNHNNGTYPAYGRVDGRCWGGPAEAHELVHMLGGVQPTAPHATRMGHCHDEADLMCYQDEPGVQVRHVCPPAHEARLDCNGDDYFNVAPAPGSYLADHWNVANSAFLIGAPAPPATVEYRFAGSLSGFRRTEGHAFDAAAGPVSISLQHATGPSRDIAGVAVGAVGAVARGQRNPTAPRPATWTVRVLDHAGRTLGERRGTSGALELRVGAPTAGEYRIEIVADGDGTWSAVLTAQRR